ncbi:hypothetical protein BC828DRAFT_372467 [Blastocladiella britannica]|nr:hypothetical protein BC828DRAFT_372467 [Blastocladiella britannica]
MLRFAAILLVLGVVVTRAVVLAQSTPDCSFMCRKATWQTPLCYAFNSTICHYQKLQLCRDPAPGNATEALCITGPINIPCDYSSGASACPVLQTEYPNCGNFHCEIGEQWSCPQDCAYYADTNLMRETVDVFSSCPSLDPLTRAYVLSFDDGPTQFTKSLLDVLKQKNRLATFFMVGSSIQQLPAVAQDVAAAGHIIGSHTYSHFNMSLQSNASLRQDLALQDYVTQTVLGLKPKFVRPPYGSFTRQASSYYNQTDLHLVAWNIDSFDYLDAVDPAVVHDWIQLWTTRNPGFSHLVYLGHDTSQAAVDVVAPIINQLEQAGYVATTLDNCIYGTHDRALWTASRDIQPNPVQRLVLSSGNGNVYTSSARALAATGGPWVSAVVALSVAGIMNFLG